jgi:putative nucleotidyltransferase with HDIG domain
MIDLERVKSEFRNFVNGYDNQTDPGFELKVVHTMHVVENAKLIATKLNLPEEDIELAQVIAYLHDIGRFEELKDLKGFDSVNNDHALYGSKMLFEKNLIRKFLEDDSYDSIIKNAVENHSKYAIKDGLNQRELLHARIIRDADKLDNFRVKKDEPIEALFPGKFSKMEEFSNSPISDKVYKNILNHECVDIRDREQPLDYFLCILAFAFDMNFKETLQIVKENDYINVLLDKFEYTNTETAERIKNIRKIMNNFIDKRIEEQEKSER